MSKTHSPAKNKIIQEFETMKSCELTARDLYQRIAADPGIGPQKIKTAFTSLAADEQRHAGMVQEIIDIVSNAL